MEMTKIELKETYTNYIFKNFDIKLINKILDLPKDLFIEKAKSDKNFSDYLKTTKRY